ncbi:MAG: uracil-DNA glycosylase family protein [Cocleimonas sp.]
MFDIKNYREEIDKFKDEYLLRFPESVGFAIDGPNDCEVWADSEFKILFLLKETYSKTNDCICMDSHKYNDPKSDNNFYMNRTNRHVARIGYGILEANKSSVRIKTTGIAKQKLASGYCQVSTIQIKKSSNSKWQSSDKSVLEHAVESKEFLKWQIDTLKPDLIFCCGAIVSKFYRENICDISKEVVTSNNDGIVVINSEHPSAVGYKVDDYIKKYQDFRYTP